jgi:FkbH-like protein
MPAIQRHWPAPDAHLFGEMIANEVRAMWSTAHAANRIKLLVVDLDNTLWRGVLSEEIEGRAGQVSEAVNQRFYRQFGVADGSLYRLVEGWPYALMEALHWCKARGIVLAIASKNNEADTLANLQQAYNGLVDPASFVSVKINWRPKAENMREILQETNLLPGNVLFIDDNPLERQQMEAAYPDMLIMGRWMGYAKSVLHHSVLAQVPRVSDESARRTDMLKGSVAGRRALHAADAQPGDSGAALAAMAIRAQVDELPRALDGSAAARALELLNKTNQFNLNGTRLSADALDQALGQGCRWFSLAVSDRYTEHGLVGVAIVNRNGILVQWALSCRVLGLQVEAAFLQRVRQRLAREHLVLLYRPTERNFPLQAWMAAATAVVDGVHRLPAAPMPAHVAMTDTPDHAEGVDPGHDPMPEARRTPFPPSAATA